MGNRISSIASSYRASNSAGAQRTNSRNNIARSSGLMRQLSNVENTQNFSRNTVGRGYQDFIVAHQSFNQGIGLTAAINSRSQKGELIKTGLNVSPDLRLESQIRKDSLNHNLRNASVAKQYGWQAFTTDGHHKLIFSAKTDFEEIADDQIKQGYTLNGKVFPSVDEKIFPAVSQFMPDRQFRNYLQEVSEFHKYVDNTHEWRYSGGAFDVNVTSGGRRYYVDASDNRLNESNSFPVFGNSKESLYPKYLDMNALAEMQKLEQPHYGFCETGLAKGACQAFVIQWLKNMYENKDATLTKQMSALSANEAAAFQMLSYRDNGQNVQQINRTNRLFSSHRDKAETYISRAHAEYSEAFRQADIALENAKSAGFSEATRLELTNRNKELKNKERFLNELLAKEEIFKKTALRQSLNDAQAIQQAANQRVNEVMRNSGLTDSAQFRRDFANLRDKQYVINELQKQKEFESIFAHQNQSARNNLVQIERRIQDAEREVATAASQINGTLIARNVPKTKAFSFINDSNALTKQEILLQELKKKDALSLRYAKESELVKKPDLLIESAKEEMERAENEARNSPANPTLLNNLREKQEIFGLLTNLSLVEKYRADAKEGFNDDGEIEAFQFAGLKAERYETRLRENTNNYNLRNDAEKLLNLKVGAGAEFAIYTDSSAHATAVFRPDQNNMIFFDPNDGASLVKRENFVNFLTGFLKSKYGDSTMMYQLINVSPSTTKLKSIHEALNNKLYAMVAPDRALPRWRTPWKKEN